jgi:hypothetical protein|tara:strand:+ start:216 stop:626 length:411 start_codon:yes stop_codon:yes gene_type:complete
MKKLLPLLILTLFVASCVAPFAMSGVGQGDCVAGDCENGGGHKVFIDGSQYIGGWSEGKSTELGIVIDKKGFIVAYKRCEGDRDECSQSISANLQKKYSEAKLPQFHIKEQRTFVKANFFDSQLLLFLINYTLEEL